MLECTPHDGMSDGKNDVMKRRKKRQKRRQHGNIKSERPLLTFLPLDPRSTALTASFTFSPQNITPVHPHTHIWTPWHPAAKYVCSKGDRDAGLVLDAKRRVRGDVGEWLAEETGR